MEKFVDEKSLMNGIRELRKELNLTQLDLAKRIEKSYPTVQRYEGVRPPAGLALLPFYEMAVGARRIDLIELFTTAILEAIPENVVDLAILRRRIARGQDIKEAASEFIDSVLSPASAVSPDLASGHAASCPWCDAELNIAPTGYLAIISPGRKLAHEKTLTSEESIPSSHSSVIVDTIRQLEGESEWQWTERLVAVLRSGDSELVRAVTSNLHIFSRGLLSPENGSPGSHEAGGRAPARGESSGGTAHTYPAPSGDLQKAKRESDQSRAKQERPRRKYSGG